ncbi:MAG: sulfatase [Bacteroidota bacterium]
MRAALLAALALLGAGCARLGDEAERAGASEAAVRPNVLLLIVDDLRPEVGIYGADIETPHIDALAEAGVRFDQHRVNVPVCGPSRATLLAGVRGTEGRFLRFDARADAQAPLAEPLPAFFRRHGYAAYSLGKVLHDPADHAAAWSAPPWQPDVPHLSKNYVVPRNRAMQAREGVTGPATEAAAVPDDAYVDGMIAARAEAVLDTLGQDGRPFLLAVGFLRPHLPFAVPQRYWNETPEGDLPADRAWPRDAPRDGRYVTGELLKYAGLPEATPFDEGIVRRLRRGYRASVRYVDAQVGRVLAALEASGQADDTVVVLWGDHGFLLGEHGLWAKHVTLDLALRSPLIVRGPGVARGAASGLVETVDVYPTLAALAGLPAPDHAQGQSVLPLLRDPSAPGKPAVFSRFRAMETVTTPTHALTLFADAPGGPFADSMLFDHRTDPAESRNVMAEQPDAAARLSRMLRAHLAERE